MTEFTYQLYTSRKFPPLADTLAMLARAGYVSVEGYGALYADDALVADLVRNLEGSGLTMPSGHFSLDMIETQAARVLDTAAALGIRSILVPHIAADRRPDTGAGWEALGRRVAEAGKPIRDAGLRFGWHNHDFEFIPTDDGALPQAAIFAGAPDLEWEADLAWVARGGGDAMKAVADFRDRITAVHLKDIAPAGQATGEDGWADLGAGTVDWAGLIGALEGAPVRLWVVEHDNPSDDRRFAEASLAAATSLLAAR
jgi:sugar phosphate isomerase/epimerase